MLGINTNPFLDRTISSFGVAIGTGMALESIFEPTGDRYDVDRKIPNKIELDTYSVHQYNILTIARNILQSVTSTDRSSLTNSKYFKETVQLEVDIITSLYDNVKPDIYFYFPDYLKMYKQYNKDKDVGVMKGYIEYSEIKASLGLKYNEVKKTTGKSLLFTNVIFDFINRNTDYHLLESHTGKLKDRSLLNTKYHPLGKKDLSHLPLVDILLYILGDKVMVKILKLTTRRALLELSINRNWNIKTSKAKVVNDLKNNDLFKDIINVL